MLEAVDWQDIQLFLAAHEHGSLSAAARALKLGQATMSRRLATLAAALENALAFTQAIAPARLDPLQQGLLHHGMQQLLCCMLARCQIPARRHRHHTRKQARRQRGGKARRQAGQAASSQQRLRLACFEIVGEQLLHRQAVDRRPDATMTQSASGTGQKTRGKRHETRDAKDAHLLY